MSDLKKNFDEDMPTSIELNYRRYLLKVCMVVALSVLIVFGVRNFMDGRYFIGLILSSMDFLFAANKHVVLDELNFRFYLSFLLVIIASFFFERIKRKYQMELIDNQRTLKESEQKYRVAYEQLNREMKERQRVEDALSESEERFREMAELMPQTLFETDVTGKLTFVNRNAFDNFGYSQVDFNRGVNSLEMLIPGDRERAAENIMQITDILSKKERN